MSRTLIILLVLPMAVFNQQSCLVPSELNFIAENRVLLLTEGRCFLGCFTHPHPSFARASTIDRTTYETWPFPILNDNSDCNDQEIVHECVRGCRTWLTVINNNPGYNKSSCIQDCKRECREELVCNAGNDRCMNLDTIDLWIARSSCPINCRINPPCATGCTTGGVITGMRMPIHPTQPFAPPRLTPPDNRPLSSYRVGAYSINLTEAMPPAGTTNPPLVGFLFKIYDNTSGNITYIWQHDPREDLDLSSHACRTVDVSFAVVSSAGPSNFSDVVTLEVYGESSRIPLPPEIVQVTDEEDRRTGFFQHVAINITWQRPENTSYLTNYTVMIISSDTGHCGTSPPSITINPDGREYYSVLLEASTPQSLPVMNCTYMLTVTSVGEYRNRSSSQEYTVQFKEEAVADYIKFSCTKSGKISSSSIFYFEFNLTWSLEARVAHAESFNMTTRIVNIISSGIESPVPDTERALSSIRANEGTYNFSRVIDDDQHNYRPRLNTAEFFRFELEINWNTRALFFPPPQYIYKCTLDAMSPRPSEIVNFTLLSYEVQSLGVRIEASWEPPAEVNGILRSYTMCVTPTPLQGHEEGHSNCRENIQNELKTINTTLTFTSSSDDLYLYLQMRAHNDYVAGNWTEPVIIPFTSDTSGLGTGPILGISYGATIAVIVAVLCAV